MWRIDQVCFDEGIAFSPDIFFYHLLIKTDPAFVAVEGRKIVAFILTARERNNSGQIVTIDVLPAHRKRGIGRKLMELAENSLSEAGVKTIKLQSAVDNSVAISFYKKLDYTQKGLLKNYYGNSGDAFLFTKELSGGLYDEG
ncbi:MAG: GNAT family N-acetyltransferase [Nitrospinota bacterium]|nr:GNAT family N-acetyltransferase [Nitrospinota bacterium]